MELDSYRLHSFIYFISQNTGSYTYKKIHVLKVFHRTEKPEAVTTAHTHAHTKHKESK